jgi:hypothetical protein
MIDQPWHYDKCDKVQLSASMLRCATTADDDGNTILSAPDYGVIDDLAELATQLLPGFAHEGANWDGVVWLERLENAEEGSLAHHLLYLLDDGAAPAGLAALVEYTLIDWLRSRGIPLRSHNLSEE